MRHYFIFFFIPLALVLATLAILLALGANVTVQSNYWEVEGYRHKLALAQTQTRKMLIVAGSNAYFGIKARELERATGLRTINMGMQAALSFDFVARLVADRLQPGDIVLLPLEYTYYGNFHSEVQQQTNTLEASVALSLWPSYYFTKLVSGEWLSLIRHLTFKRLWEGVHSRFDRPADIMPYHVAALDRWGDNTEDYRSDESVPRLRAVLAKALARGLTQFDPYSRPVQEIEHFINWSRSRGVTLLAAFPSTLDAPPFRGHTFERLRQEILQFWLAHQIPFVDDSTNATFDWGRALDTPYHQTLEGAELRTSGLIGHICETAAVLCNPAPVSATPAGR